MHRLLIVDDEEQITDGLYDVFEEQSRLDLEVYKAYSATEALEVLRAVRTDVVLSDIHMPGMDGLDLMDEILRTWPECRLIFLTGYAEFDELYSAIQHPGVNYLLKTEGFETIVDKVGDVIDEVEHGRRERRLVDRAARQIRAAAPVLQRDFAARLARGEIEVSSVTESELEELCLPLVRSKPLLLMLGRIDEVPEDVTRAHRATMLRTLHLVTEAHIADHATLVQAEDEYGNVIWILQPPLIVVDEGVHDRWSALIRFLRGTLELIQSECQKELGTTTSFVLDDGPTEWTELPERFERLRLLLSYRLGHGRAMLFTETVRVRETALDRTAATGSCRYSLERLRAALENWRLDSVRFELNSLAEQVARYQHKDQLAAQELYYSVAVSLLAHMNRRAFAELVGSRVSLFRLLHSDEFGTWREAADYLLCVGEAIVAVGEECQERMTRDVIREVQEHVNTYADDPDEITLVRLADLVHLNHSYLSRLYRQVTGVTLSEHIAEARLRLARELLEDASLRVQDVADAIGFASSTNFGRFFKRRTGQTPQEFRESHEKRS